MRLQEKQQRQHGRRGASDVGQRRWRASGGVGSSSGNTGALPEGEREGKNRERKVLERERGRESARYWARGGNLK